MLKKLINHNYYLGSINIFINKNVKRVCPPFSDSFPGLGVFTNFELYIARKKGHLSNWEKLINRLNNWILYLNVKMLYFL